MFAGISELIQAVIYTTLGTILEIELESWRALIDSILLRKILARI